MLQCASMRRTIGIVTVARSDWGHLLPLLHEIRASPDLDLALFVAGSHLAPRFGRTVTFIEDAGWKIDELVEMQLDSDAPDVIARAIGVGTVGFAEALSRTRPAVLVVLGDRFEMLSAAVAALPLMIPVAHVHGGEVTEAVIDEQIRHAVTKLAHGSRTPVACARWARNRGVSTCVARRGSIASARWRSCREISSHRGSEFPSGTRPSSSPSIP